MIVTLKDYIFLRMKAKNKEKDTNGFLGILEEVKVSCQTKQLNIIPEHIFLVICFNACLIFVLTG